LKESLITAPVLVLPDFKRSFILRTERSTQGSAFNFSQKDDEGRARVCSYGGRGLRPNESRWGISEIDCLAIVKGVRAYHVYLAGKPFEIVNDHMALKYLDRMKLAVNNRLTRWALFLLSYKFTVTSKQGPLLTSEDAIYRIPRVGQVTEDETELIASVGRNILSSISDRIVIEFVNYDVIPMDCAVAATTEQRRLLPTLKEIKTAKHNSSDFSHINTYLNQGTLQSNDKIARKTVIYLMITYE